MTRIDNIIKHLEDQASILIGVRENLTDGIDLAHMNGMIAAYQKAADDIRYKKYPEEDA